MEYSLLMCLLLSGQFIVSVKATGSYPVNDNLTPSNLIVCEGQTLNTTIVLALESATALPLPFEADLMVRNGTAMEGTHFTVSIPTINLTETTVNTSASGTFDVSITSINNTDDVQFMLVPNVPSVPVVFLNMSTVNVTLRNLVRPTLMFTVSVVSETEVNISGSEAISEGPCPDNITLYTVSATEIDGNGHIQMSYPSIPQGEILSGLSPSTSYHLVLSGRTQSGVIIHSDTMTVTTLPFVPEADLQFEGTAPDCNTGMVRWSENNANISTIIINYNRIGSADSSQAMFNLSSSPSTVDLTVTSSGSGRVTYEFQVQLVSSDGRTGNVSNFTVECSGSAPLAKSIMTVVLCVAMAIMAFTIF